MMENEEGSEWNIMINEANQDPLYRDLRNLPRTGETVSAKGTGLSGTEKNIK